ncbi:MAG: hypothetical protein LBB44_02165 [Endomicrobium sp.]|nr:hypothetical protein [Endomicrobium sp.]
MKKILGVLAVVLMFGAVGNAQPLYGGIYDKDTPEIIEAQMSLKRYVADKVYESEDLMEIFAIRNTKVKEVYPDLIGKGHSISIEDASVEEKYAEYMKRVQASYLEYIKTFFTKFLEAEEEFYMQKYKMTPEQYQYKCLSDQDICDIADATCNIY